MNLKKMCIMCMVLSPNCCAVTIFEYSSIRDDFFSKIDNRISNYKHMPISVNLIIQLMNSTDCYLNTQLLEYLSCLEMETICYRKLDIVA